jgi:hypothetical protein
MALISQKEIFNIINYKIINKYLILLSISINLIDVWLILVISIY